MKRKAAIPITIYKTEDSYIILAQHEGMGMANGNAVTLNVESPRGLPPNAIVHVNKVQFADESPATGHGTSKLSLHHSIFKEPAKEIKVTHIVVIFKKESGKLVSF